MPEWISKFKKKEFIDGSGKVVIGQTVWLPKNDAAKASPLIDMAIDTGDYTPKIPNEREVIKKKLKEASRASLKKRPRH